MARYSYELNKLDEAISYTERAQKLEPNNDAIFLNLGFFSILNNDIEKFCSNYYEIFKNRNKSKINWVDVLDFQLKQQETITDKNHFFNFSTGFIEYVILNQMNRESFQRIVDSYKSNNEYHCIYELGIKVLSNKINTAKPNTKNNRPIEKKKNRKSR
jgi:hypothetical protein